MSIRIPPPPSPIPGTFFFKTPGQLFAKLHWELRQLRRHLEPNSEPFGFRDVGFSAFNFAVTAWHLTDWSYRSMDDEWRNEVYTEMAPSDAQRFAGLSDDERQRAFVRALADTYQDLRICHDLANGDKHRGLSRPKCAQLSASVKSEWRDELGEYTRSYSLVIADGASQVDGVEFFKGVIRLWEQLLSSWGFIEGRLITGDESDDDF